MRKPRLFYCPEKDDLIDLNLSGKSWLNGIMIAGYVYYFIGEL